MRATRSADAHAIVGSARRLRSAARRSVPVAVAARWLPPPIGWAGRRPALATAAATSAREAVVLGARTTAPPAAWAVDAEPARAAAARTAAMRRRSAVTVAQEEQRRGAGDGPPGGPEAGEGGVARGAEPLAPA